MIEHFVLKKQEHDLLDFHVKSYYRNLNLYNLNTLFGFVISTLLFRHLLSTKQHIFFGFAWIIYMSVVHIHAILIKQPKYANSFQKRSLYFIFITFLIWASIWNVYFYYMSRQANELQMLAIILLQFLLLVINIAVIGLFERLVLICLALVTINASILIWLKDIQIFIDLSIPSYLMFLYFINFLLNKKTNKIKIFSFTQQNTKLFTALKKKNERLEQSHLAQSRYLSAASHDLRQPLHALALLTSDAQRKNNIPEVALTLNKIEQAIDSLGQSFNSMLNLSRLDAGVLKPELKPVSLQRLFDRIQIEFAETAYNKNLRLVIIPSKVWVQSDEGMLHSILSNFVSNALRYTERGRVMVGVRHHTNNQVHVLVYDTGSGVPAEKVKHIFQEYQRLEEAEQRVKGGVGLGLAISERMARLLEAELLVSSTLGHGSCFGLRLLQTPTPPATTLEQRDKEGILDALKGKRVAIIEDDETAIEYLYQLLSSWSMDVSIILSSEALQRVVRDAGDFDLILSDNHLGLVDETGLDILMTAKRIQSNNPPKCVLITGDTSSELSQLAHNNHIELFYKPLRPVRLRAHLNALLKD